jgi:RNA polymerase sigma factor (sigma-70 family)
VSARASRAEPASSRLTSASDSELFEGMARGELGQLGELFDRHHAAVRAFAERILVSPADADDLVQETFLTASRVASTFEKDASARPFLLGIAAQLARRRRRTFARLRAMLESFGRAPSAPHPTPEEEVASDQESAALLAAVDRLSLEHREVIGLVDLGGLTGVEAARALGVPVGTVWRRLHDARADVREQIKRRSR